MKKQHVLLMLFTILFQGCSSTKTTTIAINNECEEYYTYLQNVIQREKEVSVEGSFKRFYIDENIEFVEDKPKFSKFLEEFINHKDCLIGKDVNIVKSLLLPGDIPESLKDHIHELYTNKETLAHGYDEDISGLYPIRTIGLFFRTGGAIKRIELTYLINIPDIMFIHFF